MRNPYDGHKSDKSMYLKNYNNTSVVENISACALVGFSYKYSTHTCMKDGKGLRLISLIQVTKNRMYGRCMVVYHK
jgi:hypothetical protein